MAESTDRRKRIRVPVQSRIRHSLYLGVAEPVYEENSSVDISSSGISFETVREYAKGSLILLDVHLGVEPLKLLVCAARVEAGPSGYRVGAELVAIDPVQKRKMAGHLESLVDDFLGRRKASKKVRRAPAAKKKKKAKKKRTRR